MGAHRPPCRPAWPYLLAAVALVTVVWWPHVITGDPPVRGHGAPLYVTVTLYPPCPAQVVNGVAQPCR